MKCLFQGAARARSRSLVLTATLIIIYMYITWAQSGMQLLNFILTVNNKWVRALVPKDTVVLRR